MECGHFAVGGEGGELGWGGLVRCFSWKGKMGLSNWVYVRILSMLELSGVHGAMLEDCQL